MTLRLGTFNVWGLPETFGVGEDVTSRTREIARRLADAELDVLLIQEAWTEPVRRTLRAGARAAGFHVADGPGAGGGLMTLSRLPIRDVRFERFAFRGDPERLASGEFLGGKGFQTVRIEADHGPLTVVNTHLHARYRRERPRLNAAVRVAQLLQLLRRLAETEGSVVIGGDFNCADGDLEYEVFRGLSGAFELGGGGRHPTLSRANYYKRHRSGADKRIDFLFVRPAADHAWRARDARLLFAETARIRQIDRSLSDHFGFRAELELLPLVHPVAASSALPPDPDAVATAHRLLALADEEADRRGERHLATANALALAALGSASLRRLPAIGRRRLLRGVTTLLAGTAALPAAGFGALAHFDTREKRGAFADARDSLSRLAALSARGAAPGRVGADAPSRDETAGRA